MTCQTQISTKNLKEVNFPDVCLFLYLASLHDLAFLGRSEVKAQGGEKEVALCENLIFLCLL